MVTFMLESKSDTNVVYKYYPENHLESRPGIIIVDLESGEVILDDVAEEDSLCRTSADELNEMRNAINEMRLEDGKQPLTEDEISIAKHDVEWYQYADHVITRLHDELAEGKTPNQGTVMWY